jgi:general secretion pathway protein F
VASGVPVLDGLRIAAAVLTNQPMREAVSDAAAKVREGSSISHALEKSGYFPPMMIHLIASGESSGNLEGMLDRAATSQEREVETIIAASMSIFEPLLLLIMGSIVMFIVLAILLPIFNINQLIK